MDHLHYSLKRIGEVASGGVVNLFCHYNSTTSYRQLNHCILTSELTVNIKVCKEDMQCYPLIYDVNMTVNFIFTFYAAGNKRNTQVFCREILT